MAHENCMSVHDLDAAQLDELREALFYSDYGQAVLAADYEFPSLIPDQIILDYYADAKFTAQDFFCGQTAGPQIEL